MLYYLVLLLLCVAHHARASTIAFTTEEEFTGSDLGSREQTTAYCTSRGADLFGCTSGQAYLEYYGSGLPITNATVFTRYGRDIGSNASTIDLTVFPDFWIGNATDLYGACEDWTTNGCFNGLVHLQSGERKLRGCSMRFPILCICEGCTFDSTGTPTTLMPTSNSPTRSPTAKPSRRPTRLPTSAPTTQPTNQPTYVPHNSSSYASPRYHRMPRSRLVCSRDRSRRIVYCLSDRGYPNIETDVASSDSLSVHPLSLRSSLARSYATPHLEPHDALSYS